MFIYVQGIPFHMSSQLRTICDITCKILCKFKVRGGFKITPNTGNFLYCATITCLYVALLQMKAFMHQTHYKFFLSITVSSFCFEDCFKATVQNCNVVGISANGKYSRIWITQLYEISCYRHTD